MDQPTIVGVTQMAAITGEVPQISPIPSRARLSSRSNIGDGLDPTLAPASRQARAQASYRTWPLPRESAADSLFEADDWDGAGGFGVAGSLSLGPRVGTL
jgi:hypothetical protein